MRELRFVGPGEDGDSVIVETADGEEAFSLPIDDDLRGAVRATVTPAREARPEPVPITPREIQVRVRAGEVPEQIADDAGMPLERVLLFARSVLEERARITDEARRARARRNTADGQLVEFGTAVDGRFAVHAVEPSDVRWDSLRGADGQWVVSAAWRGTDTADRIARWSFALATRTLTPLDETAADLLSDRPIRPVVRSVPNLPSDATPEETTGPIPMPLMRSLDPRPGSPVASASRVVRPVTGENAAAPPLPLAGTDPPAATGGGRRSARSARGGRSTAVPAASAPTEPPDNPRGTAAVPAESTRSAEPPVPEPTRPSKPKVPSWDDILLGVRRNRD
jgi:Protein of unknown function (DUF3071)